MVIKSDKNKKITIIDTQCANIASVVFAFKRLGIDPIVTSNIKQIKNSHRIILPGVGNAKTAMANLQCLHLLDMFSTITQPLLGICLGMQLLGKETEEGNIKTLGLINENVTHLPQPKATILPHMGWNKIFQIAPNQLLKDINADSYFYFVHSYAFPANSKYSLANCNHNLTFTAVIQYENFYGVQFHPERSSVCGSKLLKNFIQLKSL